VLVARNLQKLEDVAAGLRNKHPQVEILPVKTDISDPGSVAELFEKVESEYGHAHVLVNNAAAFDDDIEAPVKDVDHEAWWKGMVCTPYSWFPYCSFYVPV